MGEHRDKLLKLLSTEGPRLHALLTRLTLNRQAAEDLMQEMFLKLDRAGGFGQAADPAAYARRTAIHLAFDWLQRCRGQNRVEALTEEPATSPLSPLAILVQQEELEQVRDALAALTATGRDCLVLHYLEQEPYEAIAAQLGKTPHQVRALCHKALGRLRLLLDALARAPKR